jgi:Uma2 family endonuclease
MGSEVKKFATYQDLLDLPDDLKGEIIAGALITSPRPGGHHTHTSASLVGDLQGPFQKGRGGPGGWWIYYEPEVHLQNDILVPDICGWKKELFPDPPIADSYFDTAPNWVCEILSPRTARVDRIYKLPIYLREKVDHVWLIDPVLHTLEIFDRGDSRWTLLGLYEGNAIVRAAPFDAIELDLSSWWLPEKKT